MWAVGASRWGRLPPARGGMPPNHRIANTGKRGLRHPKPQVSCRSSLVVECPVPIVVSPPLHHPPIPPVPPPTPELALNPFAEKYACCPSQPGITTAALYQASGPVPRTGRQVLRTMALKLIHKEFLDLARDS
ncbi:PREDICTED: uncharacterized protein LOC105501367 [Colobus angolensis palliatus]|uniref:uncharacterized protein LOC105501367 n=1 Tax=Colobus angolensis palliatus TaxID=336983 RepID=UPI0005F546E3|nr:PREDICTED: uncharacterized protein LOC105501367 [Colobus angolensis palliatus]